MTDKAKRGRPMTSHRVQVTPVFRDNPDIEKLGRALIAIAVNIAEKKKAEEEAAVHDASAPRKDIPATPATERRAA